VVQLLLSVKLSGHAAQHRVCSEKTEIVLLRHIKFGFTADADVASLTGAVELNRENHS
jgi:hypothetical protein